MSIDNELVGDTFQVSWVNSTNTPSAIYCAVYNGDEVLVESASMVDSGDGYHYYHNHTVPVTPGYYAIETVATIGGKPYKRKIKYRATLDEVD